ncbi:MAG: MinD/ParA family protein [Mycobacterium sp.]|nr:MinD/ParA family protein [Mycobacterium sp.]
MSDGAHLRGGDLPQSGPARQPAHAALDPSATAPDAPTEILALEDSAAPGFGQSGGLNPPPGRPPAPTRVYEDWQVPPAAEGYPVEGYRPAIVELEQLEMRRKSLPAKHGWRALVHNTTRINLGPGRDELYALALQERVQRIVRSTFPIAVVGVKGGVGKTVVTEVLGSTFSAVRGDRVVAVDLDPDAGNLISRHGRESALTITDLVAEGTRTRYLDVRAHTSQNRATRLEVLSGPEFARTPMPLLDSEVDALMPILNEHYSLVLMDTGTGLKTNLMTAILRQARALVVVTSASIDALEETQIGLEWLRHNGFQHLLDTMVLVINQVQRGKPGIDLGRAVDQLSRQIGRDRIFVLPFDSHLFEGGKITLELLGAKSRRGYLELAAAISELFPGGA